MMAGKTGAAGGPILLIGGSGVLGGHIARLLGKLPGAEIVLAGRNAARVNRAARTLRHEGVRAEARISADVPQNVALIADLRPRLVIDASGPPNPPATATAMACIRHRTSYIDVANSRAQAVAFAGLHEAAVAAGVLAVTGACVLPCVSMAAVMAISVDLQAVSAIRIYLCSGNQEPSGAAAMRVALRSAGRRFVTRRNGRDAAAHGWQSLEGLDLPGVAPDSGRVRRLFATIDSAEHDVAVARWPDIADVQVRSGFELGLLQRALCLAAWAPRLRLLPSLAWATGIGVDLARLCSHFGSARSVLRVEVEGIAGNHAVRRLWQLEGDDGDLAWIAAAPAAALARLLLVGPPPSPGAGVAAGMPGLREIVAELRHRNIRVRTLDLDR